jgi:hypothetical protein
MIAETGGYANVQLVKEQLIVEISCYDVLHFSQK